MSQFPMSCAAAMYLTGMPGSGESPRRPFDPPSVLEVGLKELLARGALVARYEKRTLRHDLVHLSPGRTVPLPEPLGTVSALFAEAGELRECLKRFKGFTGTLGLNSRMWDANLAALEAAGLAEATGGPVATMLGRRWRRTPTGEATARRAKEHITAVGRLRQLDAATAQAAGGLVVIADGNLERIARLAPATGPVRLAPGEFDVVASVAATIGTACDGNPALAGDLEFAIWDACAVRRYRGA